jgi:predicted enzyme related to lactoylglutathione lyase
MFIDSVFVWVSDLEASVPFYRDVIGVQEGPRYGVWQRMEVSEGSGFALHEGPAPAGGQRAVVVFRVADLDAEIARLGGLGHVPVDEITENGFDRFCTFADPDGTHIQLIERA